MLKCANFMNQKAIDEILHQKNEEMMAQDRHLGEKNPKPLYTLGSNVCIQCDYGLGIETSNTVRFLKMMVGGPIKRACFKEATNAY